MNSKTRRFGRPALAAVLLAAVAACEDARLRKLEPGMSREEVLAAVSAPPTKADTSPNIFRRGKFLVNGENIEVLLVDFKSRKPTLGALVDSIPKNELHPVILKDDKLIGWGWKVADSVTKATSIQIWQMK